MEVRNLISMGIMKDFHELQYMAIKGKLVGICSSCGAAYTKRSTNVSSNICGECMKGVTIPTF